MCLDHSFGIALVLVGMLGGKLYSTHSLFPPSNTFNLLHMRRVGHGPRGVRGLIVYAYCQKMGKKVVNYIIEVHRLCVNRCNLVISSSFV